MKSTLPRLANSNKLTSLIITTCALLFACFLAGCGTPPSQPATPTLEEMDEKAALREAIVMVLGTQGTGSERLSKIAYTFPEKGDITITWAIQDMGIQNTTSAGAQTDVVNILKVLKQNETRFTYVILIGSYSIKDEIGSTAEVEAMNLGFNKSTLDKINWEKLSPSDVYDLADVKIIHPVFQ